MDPGLDVGTREAEISSESLAAIEAVNNLDEYNILVTTEFEWNEPVIGSTVDANLPGSVFSDGMSADSLIETGRVVTLVFDDDSGDFVDVDNSGESSAGMSSPMGGSADQLAAESDWIVYSIPIREYTAMDLSDDEPADAGTSLIIDWDADTADIENLLLPPSVRSGLEHRAAVWPS